MYIYIISSLERRIICRSESHSHTKFKIKSRPELEGHTFEQLLFKTCKIAIHLEFSIIY